MTSAIARERPHHHLYLTRAYDTATPVSFPFVVDYRGLGGLSVTVVSSGPVEERPVI